MKEDYGKVPNYLVQVKEEIKRENEMIDKYVKDRMGVREKDPEHTEELDEYERAQLVSQLKAKWDVVNANYQRMTHVVNLDSVGKMRRKEQLETALKQLESDIEKLQRPGSIIVKNGW